MFIAVGHFFFERDRFFEYLRMFIAVGKERKECSLQLDTYVDLSEVDVKELLLLEWCVVFSY